MSLNLLQESHTTEQHSETLKIFNKIEQTAKEFLQKQNIESDRFIQSHQDTGFSFDELILKMQQESAAKLLELIGQTSLCNGALALLESNGYQYLLKLYREAQEIKFPEVIQPVLD